MKQTFYVDRDGSTIDNNDNLKLVEDPKARKEITKLFKDMEGQKYFFKDVNTSEKYCQVTLEFYNTEVEGLSMFKVEEVSTNGQYGIYCIISVRFFLPYESV